MIITEPPQLPVSAKYKLPAIHPEGHKFIAIAALTTLIVGLGLGWQSVGWLLALVTLWVIAFFRDPERVTPIDAGLVMSPADGLIVTVAEVELPRQLTGEDGLSGPHTRISIFMNVFDVHVNRSPIAGIIRRIAYVPGKFVNADLDKASDDNERQYFVVEGDNGSRIGFTQIAGVVARRIVRFVEIGDSVRAGQRVGLIRFGSRVDVYLPAGQVPQVAVGQRAVAGETVLARAGGPALLAAVKQ